MAHKTEMKKTRSYSSPVWSYFKICEDNAVLADCLLCGMRLTRGGNAPNRCGTTNLRRHVLSTHNIALPSSKIKEVLDEGSNNISNRKSLPKLEQGLKKNCVRKRAKKILQKVPLSQKVTKGKFVTLKEENDTASSQAEPVMCIRWNTYLSNMTSSLPTLMNDEQFVDVTLACEGQSLKCHKVLLAACSPYFHELLTSANCPHPVIVFKDYQFWELQALVAFMYSGEVNVPQSHLPWILRAAESLQIKGLAKPASNSECQEEEAPESIQPEPPVTPVRALGTKRKRKPSSHNCCKNPAKTSKFKAKTSPLVKSKGKLNQSKKKIVKLPSTKKRNLTSIKKCVQAEQFFSEENANFPELVDMLSVDLFNTSDIEEGIGLQLPPPHVDVDSILSRHDAEAPPEIVPFLANGLNPNDILEHINPDCRLDIDQDEVR